MSWVLFLVGLYRNSVKEASRVYVEILLLKMSDIPSMGPKARASFKKVNRVKDTVMPCPDREFPVVCP
tara:strand:- start:265 stop:468 length:204 start_codon:yes stop_codon:yes gene_type:complete